MIYVKLHNTDNGNMLAMCDSSLIGKVISEGDVEINLKDYSDFYKGQLVSEEGALGLVKREEIMSANIVGKESIAVCLKKGVIERKNVREVGKVPYANAFRIK
ncbi:MAG: DUF424 family protein [Candidatus Micrarchaeota archaeon]|nr:DUF424 family protein [Candidatus Micrarchaeota archaeon]